MKTECKLKTLDQLCAIDIGKTPSRSRPAYWDRKRSSGNIWLSIADLALTTNGHVNDSREYLSPEGARLCRIVKGGTLLLSFKLTLGRVAFAGTDLYTNEAIAALTARNGKELDKHFLRYYLQFFDWEAASRGDHKVKGRTLNKAKLKTIEVPLPSLAEQKRIVFMLDEAFENIANAKVNTEKNVANARDLFQAELDATFERHGTSWKEKTLSSLCQIGDGNHSSKYPKKAEMLDSGVPFIRATNLVDGRISAHDMRFISVEKHKSLRKGRLHAGDVLFTNRGDIGNVAIVDAAFHDSNLNSQLAWFRCHDEIDHNFLYLALKTRQLQAHFSASKTGAALQQFTIRQISELKIPTPTLETQRAVISGLSAVADEVHRLKTLLESKVDLLTELKKSLLHAVFNGEL